MTKRHMRAGVSALRRTWAAMHLHWRALMASRWARHHDDRWSAEHAEHEHGLTSPIQHRLAELLHMDRPLVRRLVSALSRTWVAIHLHWRALVAARSGRHHDDHWPTEHEHGLTWPIQHRLAELLHMDRPLVRQLVYAGSALAAVVLVATGLLWWRLASGPLSLDMATPWLTSAIEERLGGGHHIEVGGTQLERDDDGRTALRLRDIVVRDRNRAVVAHGAAVPNAPKAEVGLSGPSLLRGQVQAMRLSRIGAAMAVRVERDGHVNVFAGAGQRAIPSSPVIAAVPQAGMITGSLHAPPGDANANQQSPLSAVLAWLDGLDALGFDGRDLTEVGLKNGAVVVDDQRSGKQWNFQNINFSLTRPREGGLAFAVTSSGTDGPWSLTATVAPRGEGRRAVEAVIRDVSPKDILLAMRVDDDTLDA